ncbi:c-type cytochrome [Ilumatobacter sp.]|uniref:c-type cytochrome n=1 Tax=Ilumatobacter sp. TaxID=1967498 RepID=UPI003AF7A1BA
MLVPVGVVGFALIVGPLTAATAAPDVPTARQEPGAQLYTSNCAGCHQPDGEGLPGVFPPLAGNPAATDPEYVATVINEGLSGPIEVSGVTYDDVMPPVSGLSDDEIAAITTHVVALASGEVPGATTESSAEEGADDAPVETVPAEPPSAGDPDDGHDLFVGSQRLAEGGTACASCHVAGDVGNLGGRSLGPDLTGTYGQLGGEAGLAAWLSNPGSPTMMPIFAERPMTEEEISSLVAFLADAPDREEPSDAVDWLLLAGLIGVGVLLTGMAIAWRGLRRPYVQTLTPRTRNAR